MSGLRTSPNIALAQCGLTIETSALLILIIFSFLATDSLMFFLTFIIHQQKMHRRWADGTSIPHFANAERYPPSLASRFFVQQTRKLHHQFFLQLLFYSQVAVCGWTNLFRISELETPFACHTLDFEKRGLRLRILRFLKQWKRGV